MNEDDPITAAYDHLTALRGDSPSWAREDPALGVGIGLRAVDDRGDDERCLKVFVTEKRPRRSLAGPIPNRIVLPGGDGSVPVDVEALAPLAPHGSGRPDVSVPAVTPCAPTAPARPGGPTDICFATASTGERTSWDAVT